MKSVKTSDKSKSGNCNLLYYTKWLTVMLLLSIFDPFSFVKIIRKKTIGLFYHLIMGENTQRYCQLNQVDIELKMTLL